MLLRRKVAFAMKKHFGTKDRRLACGIAWAWLLLLPSFATGQEAQPAPPPEPGSEAATEVDRRLSEQDAQMEAMRQRFEEELGAMRSELDEVKSHAQDAQVDGLEEEGSDYSSVFPRLAVFGFFDVTFYKYFFEADSPQQLFLNDKSTFGVSSLNLYIKSQMTERLSALVELRFTFLPHNLERSFEVETVGNDGSTTPVAGTEYERENTWQRDPFTTENSWRGGVGIERVQLHYAPRDWLQVTVGKFLSPYGIWNTDHATTVFLTAHLPYVQIRDMIVRSQLGLMLHGRMFPLPSWVFEYGVTVSNGRGAGTETLAINDYDENKAVGLRLRLVYDTPKAKVALGGYGYYGENTNRKKVVIIDPSARTMNVSVERFGVFRELGAASDFAIEIARVRFQAEYMWRRVDYDIPAVLDYRDKILLTGDPVNSIYSYSSFLGWGSYGLLSYELPLEKWLGEMLLIPFVMYEYNASDDTRPYVGQQFLFGGLNFRPSPYVALKAEYSLILPKDERFGEKIHALAGQVAVSF